LSILLLLLVFPTPHRFGFRHRLQPRANGTLVVNPLVPAAVLPWWTVDGVALHSKIVSVVFDADGTHYHRTGGKGLAVQVNGVVVASSPTLAPLTVQL
jgi:hypothetical protein